MRDGRRPVGVVTPVLLLVAGGSETVATPHFTAIPFGPVDEFEPIIRPIRAPRSPAAMKTMVVQIGESVKK